MKNLEVQIRLLARRLDLLFGAGCSKGASFVFGRIYLSCILVMIH